jgi:hypothetical protein
MKILIVMEFILKIHIKVHVLKTFISVATLALARDQGKGVARLQAYK